MSVNIYKDSSGLQTLANGSRLWVGTKDAYNAAKQAGTLPNDILIAITDDEDDTITNLVTQDDPRAVSSGGVYTYIPQATKITTVKVGSEHKVRLPHPGNTNNTFQIVIAGYWMCSVLWPPNHADAYIVWSTSGSAGSAPTLAMDGDIAVISGSTLFGSDVVVFTIN